MVAIAHINPMPNITEKQLIVLRNRLVKGTMTDYPSEWVLWRFEGKRRDEVEKVLPLLTIEEASTLIEATNNGAWEEIIDLLESHLKA